MGKRGDDSYSLAPMTWGPSNGGSGMSRASVEDGLKLWAASRAFEFRRTAHGTTLPTRGGPFIEYEQVEPGPVALGDVRGRRVAVMFVDCGYHGSVSDEGRAYFTVVAAHAPTDYPVVSVRPERGFDKIAAIAGRDIDVESQAFNTRWRVSADDATLAHAVLSPRVIARLLQGDPRDDIPVLWDGAALYTNTGGFTAEPSELDRRVALAASLSELTLGFHRAHDAGAEPEAFIMPAPPRPPITYAGIALLTLFLASMGIMVVMPERTWWLFPAPFVLAVVLVAEKVMSARKFRRAWMDKYRRGERDE